MSPYGVVIREIRAERRVSLKQMADAVGFSSSYLSAIELGTKGAPKEELIDKTISYFNLTKNQQTSLRAAAKQSSQTIRIPIGAPPSVFRLMHSMGERASELTAREIRIIECVLDNLGN